MTTFEVLSTAFYCLVGLALAFVALLDKDSQQGTRYGTVSIAIFAYAALRVIVYFIVWLEGLSIGGACSYPSL